MATAFKSVRIILSVCLRGGEGRKSVDGHHVVLATPIQHKHTLCLLRSKNGSEGQGSAPSCHLHLMAWSEVRQTFLQQPSLTFLSTHCGDNRFIPWSYARAFLQPTSPSRHLPTPQSTGGHPVELQPVDDDHLLGLYINTAERHITYQLLHPSGKSEITSGPSCCRLRRTGLQSRIRPSTPSVNYTCPTSIVLPR